MVAVSSRGLNLVAGEAASLENRKSDDSVIVRTEVREIFEKVAKETSMGKENIEEEDDNREKYEKGLSQARRGRLEDKRSKKSTDKERGRLRLVGSEESRKRQKKKPGCLEAAPMRGDCVQSIEDYRKDGWLRNYAMKCTGHSEQERRDNGAHRHS